MMLLTLINETKEIIPMGWVCSGILQCILYYTSLLNEQDSNICIILLTEHPLAMLNTIFSSETQKGAIAKQLLSRTNLKMHAIFRHLGGITAQTVRINGGTTVGHFNVKMYLSISFNIIKLADLYLHKVVNYQPDMSQVQYASCY